MSSFFSTQELYLHQLIDKFVVVVADTLSSVVNAYSQTSQIVFFVFLLFQILVMLHLRVRLIAIMK